jgi:putative aldouronate transport system substrate-binding protein
MKRYWLRKVILLLIVLSMLVMSAAGCGSKKEDSTAKQATSVFTAVTSENSPEPEKPKEKVTLKLFLPGQNWTAGSDEQKVFDEISARFMKDRGYNVAFDIKSADFENMYNKVNLLIAADDLDAFNVSWYINVSEYLFNESLLMPVEELLNNFGQNILKSTSEEILNTCRVDNELRGIPVPPAVSSHILLWIRNDLLEKANMSIPQTIEDFEKALRAIKAQNPNIIPLSAPMAGYAWLPFLGMARPENETDANGNLLPRVKDYYYTAPEFKNYMTTLQRWYRDGLINRELFTWDAAKNTEQLNKGNIAAYVDGWWMRGEFDRMEGLIPTSPLAADAVKQKWVLVEGLKDDRGQYTHMGIDNQPDRFIGILKSSKNAEAIVSYMDWVMADISNAELVKNGILGVHYEKKDGKIVSINPNPAQPLYTGYLFQLTPNVFSGPLQKALSTAVHDDWLKPFEAGKFATSWNIDSGSLYKIEKSKSIVNDLNTKFDEYFMKIILGELEVSSIDTMINEMDKIGVQQYMQEINEQFKTYGYKK